jgi:hypothetical protein
LTQEVTVSPDDYSAKIAQLASGYVSDNVRLWQRYGDGLRRVSEGALPRGDAAGTARSDIPTVAQQVMQLNLTHYSDLLKSYADFTNRLLSTVFQAPAAAPGASASPPSAAASTAAGASTPIELTFSGTIGESLSQSFAIANKKAEPIDVAFELTEFVSEEGTSRFRAPVTFVPDVFVLPPGAECVVECRVSLIPAFVPGTRYMAVVRVAGFPALETALIVVPRGAAAQASPEQANTPVEDSGKDRRSRKMARAKGKTRRTLRKSPPRSA